MTWSGWWCRPHRRRAYACMPPGAKVRHRARRCSTRRRVRIGGATPITVNAAPAVSTTKNPPKPPSYRTAPDLTPDAWSRWEPRAGSHQKPRVATSPRRLHQKPRCSPRQQRRQRAIQDADRRRRLTLLDMSVRRHDDRTDVSRRYRDSLTGKSFDVDFCTVARWTTSDRRGELFYNLATFIKPIRLSSAKAAPALHRQCGQQPRSSAQNRQTQRTSVEPGWRHHARGGCDLGVCAIRSG